MEAEHVVADDLVLEADAARALDAALFVQEDQVAQRHMLVEVHLVVVDHAADAGTVFERLVLQRAFAALVADRAVERVAGQQEFDHVLARVGDLLGRGADHQPVADGGRAGGLQLGQPADLRVALVVEHDFAGGAVALDAAHLDQAHAAHADRLHLRVVAEHRDVVADPFGGIDQIRPFRNVIRLIVNVNLDRIRHSILQKDRAQSLRAIFTLYSSMSM